MSEGLIFVLAFVCLFAVLFPLILFCSIRGKARLKLANNEIYLEFDKGTHREISETEKPKLSASSARYWIALRGTKDHFRLNASHPMKIIQRSPTQFVISAEKRAGKILAEFRWREGRWHVCSSASPNILTVNNARVQEKALGNGSQISVGKLGLVFQDFGPSDHRRNHRHR